MAARARDGHIEAAVFAQKADGALRVRAHQRENCVASGFLVCAWVRGQIVEEHTEQELQNKLH